MTVAVLLLSFAGLLVIGAPVAVALGGSAILASMIFNPIPPEIVGQKVLANLMHFTLMAVPFFFFTAALMETGGLVRRLVNLANASVGHWRGGLGITAVLSSMLFAAISGSSPATVAAVGRVMYPSLVSHGYSPPLRDRRARGCGLARHPHSAEHSHDPLRLRHRKLR